MSAIQPLQIWHHPTRGQFPVLMGVFGDRERIRFFLDPQRKYACHISNAELISGAIARPEPPYLLAHSSDRTVIFSPDLNTLLPVLKYSSVDPGPTVTLGLVYARDTKSGAENCSFHRITIKPGSVTIAMSSTGHLRRLLDAHSLRGQRLEISVNIGLDPVVYIASALSQPAVKYGENELGIAGAIRKQKIELAPCFSHSGVFINHAEIVLEASIGNETEMESGGRASGLSMPEYLGYYSSTGRVSTLLVTALSHRVNAIYQTLSGPGREQSELLGVGVESSALTLITRHVTSKIVNNIVSLPAGGGHLLLVLQVRKKQQNDDENVIVMANIILENIPVTKHVFIVDEDVNPYSHSDVMWALATRFRAETDLYITRCLQGNPLDPSQSSLYIPDTKKGQTKKSVFDCTVPFRLKKKFRRAFI
ncbi:UbiD family decarboxylase domain-containing protein [Acerihabitans arboris]|uniref:UbiD family decarboxylase domain-containing protein n=1 Tax=Acerihabitans arboris TaxID=2691583 RepID=UPI0035E43A94